MLAAVLVLVPVISVVAIGGIVVWTASLTLGGAVILSIANSFLLIGTKTAVIVPLVVWRGLDAVTYFLIFLIVIADNFIELGMTMHFHLGTRNTENPVWIALTIFLVFVAVSVALTRMLLTQSSSPYRARTMPLNAWSMMRK